MAKLQSSPPVVSEGPNRASNPWNRASEGRFEWVSSSPSPAVVAEMERLFPEIIQAPVDSLAAEASKWLNQAIIARSLSRWIPPEAIIREFLRAGITGDIDSVTLSHRHYIFRFSDPQALELVLGRPWVANGQPLAIAPWVPDFVPEVSSIVEALLWIRLPQLPIEYWTDQVLSSILSAAGEYLFSDASTKERIRGGYARACVRIDLSKPLRPGARIRGNGEAFWQQFSYENLDGICGSCGGLHLVGDCGLKPGAPSSSSLAAEPRFGPWMAAIRRRKLPSDLLSEPRQQASFAKSKPPPSSSSDGWSIPRKVARRQSGRGSGAPETARSSIDLLQKEEGGGRQVFPVSPVPSSRNASPLLISVLRA